MFSSGVRSSIAAVHSSPEPGRFLRRVPQSRDLTGSHTPHTTTYSYLLHRMAYSAADSPLLSSYLSGPLSSNTYHPKPDSGRMPGDRCGPMSLSPSVSARLQGVIQLESAESLGIYPLPGQRGQRHGDRVPTTNDHRHSGTEATLCRES